MWSRVVDVDLRYVYSSQTPTVCRAYKYYHLIMIKALVLILEDVSSALL
jgi:hypothetical protein